MSSFGIFSGAGSLGLDLKPVNRPRRFHIPNIDIARAPLPAPRLDSYNMYRFQAMIRPY